MPAMKTLTATEFWLLGADSVKSGYVRTLWMMFAFYSLYFTHAAAQAHTDSVRERLLNRLEKRMEALQRLKLDGFQMVISELEVEQDYLRRAKLYLEE